MSLDPNQVDGAGELARLRKQVITQARELAVIRWELAALVRERPLSSGAMHIKYQLARRFPGYAYRIRQACRIARSSLMALRRRLALGRGGTRAPIDSVSSLHQQLLLIGDGPIAGQIAGTVRSSDVIRVTPGAGFTRSLSVPQTGEPPLRVPMEGSFVRWLIEDSGALRHIGTIVVDAADELSLGLLRGRLSERQRLALTTTSSGFTAELSLAAELGRPAMEKAGVSWYTNFPPSWLDPLDSNREPAAAILSRQSWPKISVVMVSFNQAVFLEEGLCSILEQGYPNLEFIVIDGNSTDGSVDILNAYRSRISDLLIEPDRGQSDGLNKGFARTTGDILTWVNSDDLLEPGALFRVAQAFMAYGSDMVAGGCRQIGYSRNHIILNHHNRLPFGLPVALPLGLLLDMDRFWLTGSFFYQPEVFFTRAIWNRSGGKLRTDLNYVLDYDLWVRMAAAGATIVHIPDFLACSRTHDQQKTTVGMPQMPEVQRLLRDYAKRLVNVSAEMTYSE
jgi:hypothetical protein